MICNDFIDIATKGRSAFLLRKSAVLGKKHKVQKQFLADYSVLDRPDDYYDEECENHQATGHARYSNTYEMTEENKDEL